MHIARTSLWIAVAMILATMDISPAQDKEGNDVPIEVDYSDGGVR